MTLRYLSGRVSRFGVGVPGFSTNTEVSLDVAGALGIGTTQPRAEIDTPNISVRGQIVDSDDTPGPFGYFLSADVNGIRWVAASPIDLNYIRVFDEGQQVGLSSFNGLNFDSNGNNFVEIAPNPIDPSIANIAYDLRWLRYDYGTNSAIATGFGPDGTYASIPGFGTSEAVGVTSVGIGTNQPQDDFQVGIGSTGVTINGPEGRLEAQTIKAKNVEIDGNITVESLVVRPGIATIAFLEVENDAKIPLEYVGVSSIKVAGIDTLTAQEANVGFGSIGFGATTDPALTVTGVTTLAGLTTTLYDLYVGNDLFVAGEQFIEQLNANNILVTGIATIKSGEFVSVASTDLAVSGFTTLTDFSANAGVVTQLTAEGIDAGIGTFGFAKIDDADIGIVTVGIATVGELDVGFASVRRAQVGVLTSGFIEVGVGSQSPGLLVNGISTFTGFGTFLGDLEVGNDLTVGGELSFQQLNGVNLNITGVATINNGIATNFNIENFAVSGFSTLADFSANAGLVTDITVTGVGTIRELDVERGRVGILTGDQISYGLGTITDFTADVAGINTVTGSQLFFNSNSVINGVGFGSTLVNISQNLQVQGITTFRGVGTFGTDLYVGNDLFVAGELQFEQLTGTNLLVTGIATINQLEFAVGIGSTLTVETLDVTGIGTIETLVGTLATITELNAGSLAVIDPQEPLPPQFTLPPPLGNIYSTEIVANRITAADRATIGFGGLEVLGVTTTFDLDVRNDAFIQNLNFVSGLGTHLDLGSLVVGIATVEELDVEEIVIGVASVGVATVGDLLVTGVTTFQGVVNIEDVAFINAEVTGIATINSLIFNTGVGTDLVVETQRAGVVTAGIISASNVEALVVDTAQLSAQRSFIDFGFFGGDDSIPSLYNVGISTFDGDTLFIGDVLISGNLTVTGVTTFAQLDAEQSQIGILTVFNILDATGQNNLSGPTEISGDLNVTGIATIGLSTFTPDGDVNINRNLTVGGITTFFGIVNIPDQAIINLEVTDTAYINNLFANVGIATTFSANNFDANIGVITSLSVTGASTFTGVGTFQNDLYVADDLYVSQRLSVGTTATTEELVVNDNASILTAGISTATIGFATVNNAYVGVLTTGELTIESLDVLGVSTFRGDVEMQQNLQVDGFTSTNELSVAGVATIGVVTAPAGFIDILEFTSATGAAASIGYLNVGVGSTTQAALNVTGLSTFTGLTTFVGDVYVDGNFFITGISSFQTIGADFGLIGILTASQFLDANDVNVSGFTTLSDFSFSVGVGSTISVVDANVSGILSTKNLFIEEDLDVGRNLQVAGITSLGGPGPSGITTTRGDLYVGGDLYVLDDIVYDEIIGRNLFISGIATINQLEFNVGIGTSLQVDTLNFNTGIGSTLTVDNISVGVVTVGLVTAGDVIVGGALTVVGESTFQGHVQIDTDLNVDVNANVAGILTAQNIEATNILATVGIITTLSSSSVTISDTLTVDGVSNLNIVGIQTLAVTDASAQNLTVTTNFNSLGLSTFQANLDVNGSLFVGGTINAPTGIITTLNGNTLNYQRANITDQLNVANVAVTTSVSVGQTVTTQDLIVGGTATVQSVDVGVATVGFLSATNAFLQNFTYNTGSGETFQADEATIELAGITTANVDYANVTAAQVGVATIVTTLDVPEVDIQDITRLTAYTYTTTNTATQLAFTIPSDYTSFDITMQITDGPNLQSTKINGVNNGSSVFFNEYASVFSSSELGAITMQNSAGATGVLVTSATTGPTVYKFYVRLFTA